MKTTMTRAILLLLLCSTGFAGIAQTLKADQKSSTVKIDGTSNIHDWTIDAESINSSILIEMDEGKTEEIKELKLQIPSESLKSGKSGMDKNTYKALDTDKNKTISFTLKEKAEVRGENVSLKGTLTIAGKSKNVTIKSAVTQSGNKTRLQGSHTINMKDYRVEPPTAMFGTITTGEQVTVKFNLLFQ